MGHAVDPAVDPRPTLFSNSNVLLPVMAYAMFIIMNVKQSMLMKTFCVVLIMNDALDYSVTSPAQYIPKLCREVPRASSKYEYSTYPNKIDKVWRWQQ